MKLVLAPMEGLTDPNMRHILTAAGAYDWCVSEFIRVTSVLLPAHVFLRYCPEAHRQWQTSSGTPLHPQLLGNDPVAMADNAAKLAQMGAPAIDLNFGCPAKTVNRHRGGAVLLDETALLYQIVAAVRAAVPATVPVSVKMRLGNESPGPALQNALAVESAGASWLTVHARCRVDGYRPPAYWHLLAPLRQQLRIPLIANGELWSEAEVARCQAESGCEDFMLGRGAVVRPDLSVRLRQGQASSWRDCLLLQQRFLADGQQPVYGVDAHQVTASGLVGRYKQWLGMLSQGHPEAAPLWQQVKRSQDLAYIRQLVDMQLEAVP